MSQACLNLSSPCRFYPLCMSIGTRLRQLRKENHLTQDQVAEICEVTKSMVSFWESGTNQPTIEKLLRLRTRLDFSMDWLITGQIADYSTRMRPAVKSLLRVAENLPDQAVNALTREGTTYAELLGDKHGVNVDKAA